MLNLGLLKPLVGGLFWLVVGTAVSAAQEQTPVNAVNGFYNAMAEGKCDLALDIRPGYNRKKCMAFKGVRSLSLEQKQDRRYDPDRYAIVYMTISFLSGGDTATVPKGYYVPLKKVENNWIIINRLSSQHRSFDAYLGWLSEQHGFEDFLPPKRISTRVLSDDPLLEDIQASAPQPDRPIKRDRVRQLIKSARVGRDFHPGTGAAPAYDDSTIGVAQIDNSAQNADLPPYDGNNPAIQRSFTRPTFRPGPTGKPAAQPVRKYDVRTISRAENQGTHMWQFGGPSTFGSARLLKTCWSSGELVGRRSEKKTRRKGPGAWMGPPVRKRPNLKLATLPLNLRKSIRRVDTGGRKFVALTFDTGEQNNDYAGYDGEIVDYLRRNNIKATFYFGGKWMATHKERALQLIADPLFEMGNHAWTHGNLRVMRGRRMRDQILFTQAQYELLLEELQSRPCAKAAGDKAFAQIPALIPTFRYPYGTCSAESLRAVNDAGLPAVQWDVVTGDPARGSSAAAIARTVLAKTKPGSIIIMHSNGRGWNTGKALRRFIPKLAERGYKFLTVSELLQKGKPVATKTCYELRPGDNKHYDRLFGEGTGD